MALSHGRRKLFFPVAVVYNIQKCRFMIEEGQGLKLYKIKEDCSEKANTFEKP